MKQLIFAILCLSCASAEAQINWKKEIWPCLTMMGAGAADGAAESVKWHYHTDFTSTFPNANPKYWNPDLSYKNKYANGNVADGPAFFGSTTFLAWTTDGYHLMRSARNALITTTILIYPKQKMPWYHYAIRAAVLTCSYALGFHLTYTLIIKQ